MDRWAWSQLDPWLEIRRQLPIRRAAMRGSRTDRRPALGGVGSAKAAPSRRRSGSGPAAIRPAPAPTRPRGRDGTRGRSAGGHPAAARTRQPRDHQHLPAGDRQRRDHRHGSRTPIAGDLRDRRTPAQTVDRVEKAGRPARIGRPATPSTGEMRVPTAASQETCSAAARACRSRCLAMASV